MDLAALTTGLAPQGLNAWGVADPARWDALVPPEQRTDAVLPGARAIVVFGSGGPALWHALLADVAATPAHLADEAHPLDAFVRRAVQAADAHLGATRRRWVYAAADASPLVDFRTLGWLAGLGGRSRLGLLLHPEYGPWLGLRAACFVDAALAPAAPVEADPCAGCPAPCVSACPGAAFPGGTWAVAPCAAFHAASDVCTATCHAREACPAGADHRYPREELTYHYDRRAGRAFLQACAGLAEGADGHQGVGPHWRAWEAR